MAKKIVNFAALTAILGCCCAGLGAQEMSNIDFGELQQRINDCGSATYYPSLYRRYLARDTSLRHEDYSHLYYGFVFHEQYDPVNTEAAEREKRLQQLMKRGQLRTAARLIDTLLAADPFNLRYNYIAGVHSERLRDRNATAAYQRRWANLIGAVIASGDGRSPATAFVVIRIPDEYQVMTALKLRPRGQSLRRDPVRADRYFDVFALEPNRLGLDTLFFNISWSYQYLTQTIGEEQRKLMDGRR